MILDQNKITWFGALLVQPIAKNKVNPATSERQLFKNKRIAAEIFVQEEKINKNDYDTFCS